MDQKWSSIKREREQVLKDLQYIMIEKNRLKEKEAELQRHYKDLEAFVHNAKMEKQKVEQMAAHIQEQKEEMEIQKEEFNVKMANLSEEIDVNNRQKEEKICCYLGNQIVILEQKKICETLMIV